MSRADIPPYTKLLIYLLLIVIFLVMGCANLQQETAATTVTPIPVRELESGDNYRAIEMTLGSAANFTIKDQNIAIAYNGRDGENHLLTLTVNNETETISAGPSNKLLGRYYCEYKLGNVIFEIYPVTTTSDKDKDGRLGEDPFNEKDDDGDGLVDEDIYSYYIHFDNWDTDLLHVACFVLGKPLYPGEVAPL